MPPLFELQELTLRTRAGKRLLDSVTLAVEPGECLVVIGPNGAGKTTLLRAILGLVRPTSGSARLQGADTASLAPNERASRVAWMPQRPILVDGTTAVDLVAAARFRFHESRRVALESAEGFLASVGAQELGERLVTTLSGGEQQRVSLAATLAQEAPLILLDEPASHLDPAAQVATYELIGELRQAGLTLVCVTHDINLLRHAHLADDSTIRVTGLRAGRLVCEFSYGDPSSAETLSDLFSIRFGTLDAEGAPVLLPVGDSLRGGTP